MSQEGTDMRKLDRIVATLLASLICILFILVSPSMSTDQSLRREVATRLVAQDSSLLEVYESLSEIERRLTIQQLHLNGDRIPEILVSGVMCGAQNCPYYLFQRKGRRLVEVSADFEGIFLRVAKTRSQGWLDLIFGWHSSATSGSTTVFRFNGARYVAR